MGLARLVQNAWRAGASFARRALLRALGWGSRLALKEEPTKPNQNQRQTAFLTCPYVVSIRRFTRNHTDRSRDVRIRPIFPEKHVPSRNLRRFSAALQLLAEATSHVLLTIPRSRSGAQPYQNKKLSWRVKRQNLTCSYIAVPKAPLSIDDIPVLAPLSGFKTCTNSKATFVKFRL